MPSTPHLGLSPMDCLLGKREYGPFLVFFLSAGTISSLTSKERKGFLSRLCSFIRGLSTGRCRREAPAVHAGPQHPRINSFPQNRPWGQAGSPAAAGLRHPADFASTLLHAVVGFFKCFLIYFLIGGKLLYNAILVSCYTSMQISHNYIYFRSLLSLPPLLPSHLSRSPPSTGLGALCYTTASR